MTHIATKCGNPHQPTKSQCTIVDDSPKKKNLQSPLSTSSLPWECKKKSHKKDEVFVLGWCIFWMILHFELFFCPFLLYRNWHFVWFSSLEMFLVIHSIRRSVDNHIHASYTIYAPHTTRKKYGPKFCFVEKNSVHKVKYWSTTISFYCIINKVGFQCIASISTVIIRVMIEHKNKLGTQFYFWNDSSVKYETADLFPSDFELVFLQRTQLETPKMGINP